MKELIPPKPAEYYWFAARSEIDNVMRSSSNMSGNLVGRVFEKLSLHLVRDVYPESRYTVFSPIQVEQLKKFMNDDDIRVWGLSFPDGIIFEKLDNEGSLRLAAFAEYKMASFSNLENRREQITGFTNLIDLMRIDGASKGRNILGRFFGRTVPRLEVPDDVSFLYITPQDRSADAATTLYEIDNMIELRFPQISNQIKKRVRQIRSNKYK